MNKFLKISMLIAVVAIATVMGCKKDSKDEKPTPGGGVMQNIVLQGKVTDVNGVALGGVQVTSGSASTVTTDGGTFIFTEAEVVDKRAVIKFEKSGYFTLTRSGIKRDEMFIEAVLVSKGDGAFTKKTTFQASQGTKMNISGMEVTLPPSAFKKNGSAYNGTVNVDMLYLDPNNENFAALMPGGDLAGIREDESEAALISYGMTNVVLTDDKGEPLQLTDSPSDLTFPIPAGLENNPPATIPLWTFDEQKGIWIEEGVATYKDGVYVGKVTHFSWVNLDDPKTRGTIKGRVLDSNGNPVPNARVTFKIPGGETVVYTDSDGNFTQTVPADTPVTVTVTTDWGGESGEIIADPPPPETETTLPPIIVPAGVTIKGKVVDCNNKPVEYVLVKAGTKKEVYTKKDGTYICIVNSNDTPVTITAGGNGDSVNIPAQSDGAIYTARDMKLCDGGGDPEGTSTDKGSVKYRMPEMEMEGVSYNSITTFDQNWKRYRSDAIMSYDGVEYMHTIVLYNKNTKELWYYNSMEGKWDLQPFQEDNDNTHVSDEEAYKAMGFTKTGTTTIIGKTCQVYAGTIDGVSMEFAVWNGIPMQIKIDGKLMQQAVAVKLEAPEKAFSKETLEVDWI